VIGLPKRKIIDALYEVTTLRTDPMPLWVAAIIVMALGLGFALANRRRDRIDVVNRRADDADDAEDAEERSDSV
jgi:hypothetical protein